MSRATNAAHCLKIKSLSIAHLETENLCFYGAEAVSLKGPSGAGKSLFLKALSDLMENAGEVFLNDQKREDLLAPDWRRKVCYLSAKTAWWQDCIKDHFADPEACETGLKAFDLPLSIMDKSVNDLSSGEAQRLAILRTLANEEACFFLLDEPTSALDEERQKRVEDYLKAQMKERKFGLIFISHDDRQIARLAKRHLKIEGNRIIEDLND